MPIKPERRTRLDLVVAALIAVACLVAGLAVWLTSPARSTDARVADEPAPPAAAVPVPTELTERWRADSAQTRVPQVSTGLVITGDGETVAGRDPADGRVHWNYRRDLPLCDVLAAWPATADVVLAAYRAPRGCSEITALSGADGARDGNRTSDADSDLRLVPSPGYVLALGSERLETWGSNLVRGIEYGRVEAPVNADTQPGRVDCRLYSGAVGGERVALVERCGDDPGYRLTVLGAVLDDDEKVAQYGSTLLTDAADGPAPTVLTVSAGAISVYDVGADPTAATDTATGDPTVSVFAGDGRLTGTYSVAGSPEPPALPPISAGGVTTFWTGEATVALDTVEAIPRFQITGTLGPGEVMGDRLLLPVSEGVKVLTRTDGRLVRTIEVDRSGWDGPVALRVLGGTVVEQRGDEIVALS